MLDPQMGPSPIGPENMSILSALPWGIDLSKTASLKLSGENFSPQTLALLNRLTSDGLITTSGSATFELSRPKNKAPLATLLWESIGRPKLRALRDKLIDNLKGVPIAPTFRDTTPGPPYIIKSRDLRNAQREFLNRMMSEYPSEISHRTLRKEGKQATVFALGHGGSELLEYGFLNTVCHLLHKKNEKLALRILKGFDWRFTDCSQRHVTTCELTSGRTPTTKDLRRLAWAVKQLGLKTESAAAAKEPPVIDLDSTQTRPPLAHRGNPKGLECLLSLVEEKLSTDLEYILTGINNWHLHRDVARTGEASYIGRALVESRSLSEELLKLINGLGESHFGLKIVKEKTAGGSSRTYIHLSELDVASTPPSTKQNRHNLRTKLIERIRSLVLEDEETAKQIDQELQRELNVDRWNKCDFSLFEEEGEIYLAISSRTPNINTIELSGTSIIDAPRFMVGLQIYMDQLYTLLGAAQETFKSLPWCLQELYFSNEQLALTVKEAACVSTGQNQVQSELCRLGIIENGYFPYRYLPRSLYSHLVAVQKTAQGQLAQELTALEWTRTEEDDFILKAKIGRQLFPGSSPFRIEGDTIYLAPEELDLEPENSVTRLVKDIIRKYGDTARARRPDSALKDISIIEDLPWKLVGLTSLEIVREEVSEDTWHTARAALRNYLSLSGVPSSVQESILNPSSPNEDEAVEIYVESIECDPTISDSYIALLVEPLYQRLRHKAHTLLNAEIPALLSLPWTESSEGDIELREGHCEEDQWLAALNFLPPDCHELDEIIHENLYLEATIVISSKTPGHKTLHDIISASLRD